MPALSSQACPRPQVYKLRAHARSQLESVLISCCVAFSLLWELGPGGNENVCRAVFSLDLQAQALPTNAKPVQGQTAWLNQSERYQLPQNRGSKQLGCFQNGFSQTRPQLDHRVSLCEFEEGDLLGQTPPHKTSDWHMDPRMDLSFYSSRHWAYLCSEQLVRL